MIAARPCRSLLGGLAGWLLAPLLAALAAGPPRPPRLRRRPARARPRLAGAWPMAGRHPASPAHAAPGAQPPRPRRSRCRRLARWRAAPRLVAATLCLPPLLALLALTAPAVARSPCCSPRLRRRRRPGCSPATRRCAATGARSRPARRARSARHLRRIGPAARRRARPHRPRARPGAARHRRRTRPPPPPSSASCRAAPMPLPISPAACRCPASSALADTLVQTERFGTPLAAALAIMAAESRSARLLAAEARAARLPALMTVPMIAFVLPPLFVVLVGPAVVDALDGWGQRPQTPIKRPHERGAGRHGPARRRPFTPPAARPTATACACCRSSPNGSDASRCALSLLTATSKPLPPARSAPA